jgi:hypothetical protein
MEIEDALDAGGLDGDNYDSECAGWIGGSH